MEPVPGEIGHSDEATLGAGYPRIARVAARAFSFRWYNQSHLAGDEALPPDSGQPAEPRDTDPATSEVAGRGKTQARSVVATGVAGGEELAGAVGNAVQILERVVGAAPCRRSCNGCLSVYGRDEV